MSRLHDWLVVCPPPVNETFDVDGFGSFVKEAPNQTMFPIGPLIA